MDRTNPPEDGPLRSYMLRHPEARITDQEREILVRWANGMRASLGAAPEAGGGVEGGTDQGDDGAGEVP